MIPETKPLVTFRQRRSVPSGEQPERAVPGDTAGARQAPPPPQAPEPDDSGSGLAGRLAGAGDRLRETYRSPQSPATGRRLAAVSLWSLLLVLGGAVAYLRALLGQLSGPGTGLAGSVLSLVSFGGLVGLALIIASMLTIGKRRAP
jgi:hypothetical protein